MAIRICLLTFTSLLSLSALSGKELSRAEELFNKRAIGIEYINRAQNIYQKIIKDKRYLVKDRALALDRYARLSVYKGDLSREMYGVSSKEATSLFNKCIDLSSHLSPRKTGEERAEYYYWRSVCLGMWASSVGMVKLLFNMGRVKEMMSLIKDGQQKFSTYENHGFNRMKAAILIRDESMSKFNLYSPKEALRLIEPCLAGGTDIYMDYIVKAKAQMALDDKRGAKKTVKAGVKELNYLSYSNSISEVHMPENIVFKQEMLNMLSVL